jgi:hypothetical protein
MCNGLKLKALTGRRSARIILFMIGVQAGVLTVQKGYDLTLSAPTQAPTRYAEVGNVVEVVICCRVGV